MTRIVSSKFAAGGMGALLVLTFVQRLTSADDPSRGQHPIPTLVGSRAGDARDDNSVKMKFIWCPPGRFVMGSPKSERGRGSDEGQVDVVLTVGFWIGKYEVTQGEWEEVMGTAPWKGKEDRKEGPEFPAIDVSWDDAVAFCRRLTDRDRRDGLLATTLEYALPTEAQWEYACRAGTTTRYSFGDDDSVLGDYGEPFRLFGGLGIAPVGKKKANPWGLHDVHGNVAEWCRDRYSLELPGGNDPEEAAPADRQIHRVNRGGGGIAIHRRSATRHWTAAYFGTDGLGFRCVLTAVR